MAQKRIKKEESEHFLLIQQFWLIGTTSIQQPVITTAQFPISTLHAGTTHKSSLRMPIFRISQAIPPCNSQEHVSKHLRSELPESKTGDYIHCSLL